jgi:hypothetical protein
MANKTKKDKKVPKTKTKASNDFTAGADINPQASVSVNKEVTAETTVGGVDLEAHAGAEAHAIAGTELTNTSAAASAEVGVSVEAGASATYGDTSVEAHAGAEAHALAGAQAGFTDGNAYAQVGVEAGASATASASVSQQVGDVTVKNETTVKAEAGASAGADVQVGKDGVAGHAGAVAGASVGVENTTSAYDSNGNGASAAAGASIGVQVGAEVGGGATMDHGVATVGVSGEVALLAGVEVNTSVSVDTKPAQVAVVNVANDTANVTTQAATTVVNTGTSVVNTISDGAKNIAKKLKFW